MEDFLDEHQDLWHYISDNDLSHYPCYDMDMEPIDEEDYYGYNFSGKNRVIRIFYMGASNYFPAIKCGENDHDMDKYPVYIYDLQSDNPEEPTGLNFKQYIKSILNDALKRKKNIKKIKNALQDVEQFSDDLINI